MRLTPLVRGSIWTANVVTLLLSGALFAMWFFVSPYLQESTGTRRARRDSLPVVSTPRQIGDALGPVAPTAAAMALLVPARPAALPVAGLAPEPGVVRVTA
jgi:hypothetical protein